MPKQDHGPSTPQGKPAETIAPVTHAEITALPVETQPDTLPSREIEFVPPSEDVKIQVARETMMSSKAAEAAMKRGTPLVQPEINLNKINGQAPAAPPTVVQKPSIDIQQIRANFTPKASDDGSLDAAASLLVRRLCGLSAEWGAKIEAMRLERHLRDDQICFALMANTLDTGQYMAVPADHPYFHENFKVAGSSFLCIVCGAAASRKYPGQPPLCGNVCANQFHQLPEKDQREMLEASGE